MAHAQIVCMIAGLLLLPGFEHAEPGLESARLRFNRLIAMLIVAHDPGADVPRQNMELYDMYIDET